MKKRSYLYTISECAYISLFTGVRQEASTLHKTIRAKLIRHRMQVLGFHWVLCVAFGHVGRTALKQIGNVQDGIMLVDAA